MSSAEKLRPENLRPYISPDEAITDAVSYIKEYHNTGKVGEALIPGIVGETNTIAAGKKVNLTWLLPVEGEERRIPFVQALFKGIILNNGCWTAFIQPANDITDYPICAKQISVGPLE